MRMWSVAKSGYSHMTINNNEDIVGCAPFVEGPNIELFIMEDPNRPVTPTKRIEVYCISEHGSRPNHHLEVIGTASEIFIGSQPEWEKDYSNSSSVKLDIKNNFTLTHYLVCRVIREEE